MIQEERKTYHLFPFGFGRSKVEDCQSTLRDARGSCLDSVKTLQYFTPHILRKRSLESIYCGYFCRVGHWVGTSDLNIRHVKSSKVMTEVVSDRCPETSKHKSDATSDVLLDHPNCQRIQKIIGAFEWGPRCPDISPTPPRTICGNIQLHQETHLPIRTQSNRNGPNASAH